MVAHYEGTGTRNEVGTKIPTVSVAYLCTVEHPIFIQKAMVVGLGLNLFFAGRSTQIRTVDCSYEKEILIEIEGIDFDVIMDTIFHDAYLIQLNTATLLS
jgi:hypothetical protein